MAVAPYSPSARAKASTAPATMPCWQYGIFTRQKIQRSERPRVRAASARFSSKDSKAPRAVRYMSGKLTTTVARIAAYHTMVSLMPKVFSSHAPTVRRGPKTRSRR